jgi:hypothetical protein
LIAGLAPNFDAVWGVAAGDENLLGTDAGATTYRNFVVDAGDVPPGVMTVSATPADETAPAGDFTVIDVAVLAVTVPAVEPKRTAEAFARFVPVMVTVVPPAVVPEVGVKDVIVGAATYVKPFDRVVEPEVAVR